MKIIPLSEGSFTVDGTKKFIPFNPSADKLSDRTRGSLLVEIQPFLVITKNDVILLDAGLGMKDASGQFQIFQNLKQAGIAPSDVTKVLMSHLHKDHVGGLINPFTGNLSFENALHYVQQQEMDYALEKSSPSYDREILDVLRYADRYTPLQTDDGLIDGYIEYQVSGGHAKYHQVFWIREQGETVFFAGDEASQAFQIKARFSAKYDYDGKKAMQLREKWWEEGKKEGWTFLFYHDVKSPIIHAH
ncbi:MAG: MBL fold metallo-hydrolase [Niabella sp.]